MDPEPALRARLAGQLDARLAALDGELGGLLDRAALLLVIADEEGLLPAQATLPLEAVPEPAFEGTLERLTATRTFRRRDGGTGFVCDADVRTAQGLQRVVLWDEAVRRVQGLQGQSVRFTALREQAREGARELHSTARTRVERT